MSNNTDTIDTIEIKLSNIDITPTEKKNEIKNKTKNQLSKQKLSKIELFKKLGDYDTLTNQTRIVTKDEFVGDYLELFFKNGGDWCRHSTLNKSIYKFATMKANGREIKLLWKATDIEEKEVEKAFKNNCEIMKGTHVQYFKIFGIKNEQQGCNHPIREDIKEYYKNKPCANCGTNTDLQCDHKNGLYNDTRVLHLRTQTQDDFQSLCRHCNCQKRQIEKKTKETSIRYGATKIPSLAIFEIDFIEGNETINFEDVNALKGTYWYDPIEFMKHIKLKLTK